MRPLDRADVEIVSRGTAYRGYFRIDRYRLRHRLHGGGWSRELVRECFERGHAAAILPYDPARDMVVLMRQFRIGAWSAGWNPWIYEIVAGIIEPGETAESVALREAEEEIGCTLRDPVPICAYLSTPGGASEVVTLFCGRCDASLACGVHGKADEDEDILVCPMPFHEALDRLAAGEIDNSVTIIALQWLALHRDRLRARWSSQGSVPTEA